MIECSPAIDTFGPEQILWPSWPPSAHEDDAGDDNNNDGEVDLTAGCTGCSKQSAPGSPTSSLALSALILLGVALRRRRD
jgi:MYXO-CTERM domain-containing protein